MLHAIDKDAVLLDALNALLYRPVELWIEGHALLFGPYLINRKYAGVVVLVAGFHQGKAFLQAFVAVPPCVIVGYTLKRKCMMSPS